MNQNTDEYNRIEQFSDQKFTHQCFLKIFELLNFLSKFDSYFENLVCVVKISTFDD